MNEAAQTTQQATTEAAPAEIGGTVEERADAIFGPDVHDDGTDGDEGAATEEAQAPPTEKTPDQLAQERAARRQQALAELNARTRNAVDSKAARSEAEQLRRQLEQERAARAALVDPRQLTPLQLLELGQVAGHTPQAIAEALKQARENPEYVATHAVRKAVDPVIAQLQQQLEQERQQRVEFQRQYEQTQVQAAEEAAHGQLRDFASANAATSPYASSFLKAYGPDQFRVVVEKAMPHVVGAGPQAVLDAVEDLLAGHHKELTAWNPTATAAPQRTQANQPRPSGTATQAPTHVTNSLAQQRSSVVDEEAALENMPYEERASFIFRRH